MASTDHNYCFIFNNGTKSSIPSDWFKLASKLNDMILETTDIPVVDFSIYDFQNLSAVYDEFKQLNPITYEEALNSKSPIPINKLNLKIGENITIMAPQTRIGVIKFADFLGFDIVVKYIQYFYALSFYDYKDKTLEDVRTMMCSGPLQNEDNVLREAIDDMFEEPEDGYQDLSRTYPV